MNLVADSSGIKAAMNFKELVQHLEKRIGYHQVPMNPAATGTKDLFESCALHHELMTELVQAIYKENGCRKLSDPVNRQDTFKALSPIRLKVLQSSKTDIDVFHLIENLCLAVDQAFGGNEHQHSGIRRSRSGADSKAEVIPLDNFRYRRFNHLA